ncbi:hypothetical protein [Streptomyces sp. CB01881]|uniref:hypothetical protein n=1 Tax=Streptomyces sp. CB01881 TaxID=2078691 RepID=UPI000CDBB96E|nr:hypothetical protein [Streptomyces sp. CB01881]AUY49244.1 hypothetical protein C2142_10145 [Streptomyces sp. CB01881]TYC72636.1 hypothetical protein EH183_10155 [Streptomyces sp. CB01881]
MISDTTIRRLALLGTLLAVYGELHPFADQWAQAGRDAYGKRLHGSHPVHRDGAPVTPENPALPGECTLSASAHGRRCATRHVLAYSAVQTAGAIAVTRACGYRLTAGPLLVGTAINGLTHALIDRGPVLAALARRIGKSGYIEACAAVKLDEDGKITTALYGPGTAWHELDQELHRAISVAAAATTTWLAVCPRSHREG